MQLVSRRIYRPGDLVYPGDGILQVQGHAWLQDPVLRNMRALICPVPAAGEGRGWYRGVVSVLLSTLANDDPGDEILQEQIDVCNKILYYTFIITKNLIF